MRRGNSMTTGSTDIAVEPRTPKTLGTLGGIPVRSASTTATSVFSDTVASEPRSPGRDAERKDSWALRYQLSQVHEADRERPQSVPGGESPSGGNGGYKAMLPFQARPAATDRPFTSSQPIAAQAMGSEDGTPPRSRAAVACRALLCSLEGMRKEGEERKSPTGAGTMAMASNMTSTLHRRRNPHMELSPVVVASSDRKRKEIRILRDDEKIYDLYSWDEVLQEDGDGGKVVVCRPKGEGEEDKHDRDNEYVMKIRSKESLIEQEHETAFRKSQIRMLNFPPHVGVMPLREILEDENFYYIIMDKALGGSFFYSLLREFQDGIMPPNAVKKIMREILEAVDHVHKAGMLHRDIKPDNLVMQFHDDPGSPGGRVKKVMLIDFDHADPEFSPVSPSRRTSTYGTLRFNAPETLNGDYTEASDLWSVGTILYLLMAGKMPYSDTIFDLETGQDLTSATGRRVWMDRLFQKMQDHEVDWTCSPWKDQPDCMRFCMSLLNFDPGRRLSSAMEALSDKWLLAP